MAVPISQSMFLQAPRFAQAPKLQAAGKPVLLSSDIDDTLIHWTNHGQDFNELAMRGTVNTVNRHRDKLAVHLNTGRGLSSVQQAAVRTAPILKDLPVDFLSLNNGLELYVNKRHERADQWIQHLTEADQDPVWKAAVAAKTGWQFDRVRATREKILKANGFVKQPVADPAAGGTFRNMDTWTRPAASGHTLLVQCFGNQPGFKFSELVPGVDGAPDGQDWTPGLHRVAQRMLREYRDVLKADGIVTQDHWMSGEEGPRKFGIYTLVPKGIQKGAGIQGVLDQFMPRVQAVITAGDHHYNDTDALKPRGFRREQNPKVFVPNYPILSGPNTILQDRLKNRPRHVEVPMGYLGPGIDQQVGRIFNRTA